MIKIHELTIIVQLCGPCDEHKEEKRCKAKSHAKELCMTGRDGNRKEKGKVKEVQRKRTEKENVYYSNSFSTQTSVKIRCWNWMKAHYVE